jgi:hypothetical protein
MKSTLYSYIPNKYIRISETIMLASTTTALTHIACVPRLPGPMMGVTLHVLHTHMKPRGQTQAGPISGACQLPRRPTLTKHPSLKGKGTKFSGPLYTCLSMTKYALYPYVSTRYIRMLETDVEQPNSAYNINTSTESTNSVQIIMMKRTSSTYNMGMMQS